MAAEDAPAVTVDPKVVARIRQQMAEHAVFMAEFDKLRAPERLKREREAAEEAAEAERRYRRSLWIGVGGSVVLGTLIGLLPWLAGVSAK